MDYDKSGYVITQVHEISLDAAKIQYIVKVGELGMAIWVVEFSNGGYKIRKVFGL